MAAEGRWFVGRGVRSRDTTAYIEVLAERSAEGSYSLLANPRKVFPKTGEVELRGIAAAATKPGDWFLFQVGPNDRRGGTAAKAIHPQGLTRYCDLSHIGSLEAIRPLLVELGLARSEGTWTIRLDAKTVANMTLARGVDGLVRAQGKDLAQVPLFEFNEEAILTIPTEGGDTKLYNISANATNIGRIDWSSDANYVRRIVQALPEAAEGSMLASLSHWLKRYSDDMHARLSVLGTSDVGAAYNVLRAKSLASRLAEERRVLQDYFDAVRTDPDVKSLIKRAIDEFVAREREVLLVRAQTELEQEISRERAQRQAELTRAMENLKAEMEAILAEHISLREREIDAALREREHRGIRAIDEALARRKAELESEIKELEDRGTSLAAELADADARSQALKTSIDKMVFEEQQALERIDRLEKAETALEATPRGGHASPICPVSPSVPSLARRGTSVNAQALAAAVESCPLLSETGKAVMIRFLAAMLAGEAPILHGPQVDDFLEIAAALVSSGRSARIEADPTIISFDDLWIRPGAMTGTPLRSAAAAAVSANPMTTLGIIGRADQSGLRFWYPDLVSRARRGEIPRRLLLCVALEDPNSEEAMAAPVRACSFEISSVIADGAALTAPVLLGGGVRGICNEFDPGEPPEDLSGAVGFLGVAAAGLGVADAKRLARICIEASAFIGDRQLSNLAADIAAMMRNPRPPGSEASSGLKIVK
ncbi:hypothetical protein [Microvirga arsenatis]|uniref:Uncharacterized protein n=1 Tax=Microvirga arsenatis TaxID=2692265 RepID=A0ABW9YWV6_9HYPH|nr:hypothetical protein [Microvirga arsenatis]NBJ10927.1 hypothetical protein [Microvirga arsenatis]NBJ24176.1 hypothetical protein [Microvirga arsenatis]